MNQLKKIIYAGLICSIALPVCCTFCAFSSMPLSVRAAENDEREFQEDFYSEFDEEYDEEFYVYYDFDHPEESSVSELTGIYSIDAGWSVHSDACTQEFTVYKQDACIDAEYTSTITCGYMDTNYSVLEYEQLRDMLTNSVVYSNINAQITASALYTNEKDYLYNLIADDAEKDYREIYYYVIGDYRCFCVTVREYRAEAENLRTQGIKTPQDVGTGIAEKFVWNY